MKLNEFFSSVFSYAAATQKWINGLFADGGHKIDYSFAHDFAIGEWTSGQKGVRETLDNIRNSWEKNYKAYAQGVAQLSAMADFHYQLKCQCIDGREAWVDFYNDLFNSERERFYKLYENDSDAKSYLFGLYD